MSTNKLTKELHSAALAYLADGLSIIPIGKNKKPLFKWKVFQDRPPTTEEVETWFQKYRNSITGIALVTGKVSGLVAVDVEKGGPIDDLPASASSKSGGGGYHYFYKYDLSKPIKNGARVRDLTDIRGDGGYIILPPSLHPSGGRYEWVNELGTCELVAFPLWLIESDSNEPVDIGAPVPKGQRNETAVKIIGSILRKLDPSKWETEGWEQAKSWNEQQCSPPLSEDELRTAWESIKERETSKPEKKKKMKKQEVYSRRFGDVVLETIYKKDKEWTTFCLFDGKTWSEANSYIHLGQEYVPPPASNELVRGTHVKLPSACVEFGTEMELLREVKDFIHDYLEISEEFEAIAAYYVMFTWVFDRFKELAYLRALGDFGSGKSRFLQVMGVLCYKSIMFNGASSTSAIFRMIDEVKGTVILDEADFTFSDTTQEIVKILNSGFQEGSPVYRSEASSGKAKTFNPKPFDVFCPKVVATRKYFKDEALESRCLTHAMSSLTRDDIKENLDDEFYERALGIRNKLLSFRFQKLSEPIEVGMPKIDMEPRLRQIAIPLYSLFKDDEVREQILVFLVNKQKALTDQRYNSFEGELLRSLLSAIEEDAEPSMKEIAKHYNANFASSKYLIKGRKVGQIVDTIFHLDKVRKSKGVCMVASEENERRLEKLKKKYGLNREQMNDVNIVNVPWEDIDNPQSELFDNPDKS